jgi:hypothetical protein
MNVDYSMASMNYHRANMHTTHYWCAEIQCWQVAIHVGFGGHTPERVGNCKSAPYQVLFCHGCIDDFGTLIITRGFS